MRTNNYMEFWSRVSIRDEDSCWLYKTKGTTRPYFQIENQSRPVAVWAYFFANQYTDRQINHKCKNYLCCNPAHLFVKKL